MEGHRFNTRWFYSLVFFIACVWLIVLYFFIVIVVLPFEPYKVYGYTAIPSAACPGELIQIDVDSEVNAPWWVTFTGGTIRGYWENMSLGGTTGEESVTFYVDEQPDAGRKARSSLLLRRVPTLPGEYRIATTYEIHGRVLGYHRTDSFPVVSPPIFTSLPMSHPSCKEADGE